MKEQQRIKSILLILHVASMITAVFLFYSTPAKADDAQDITPIQTISYVTLLSGNTINITNTQTTPFGVHSVFVTSIGNNTLSANMQSIANAASGLWFISLFGTGGRTWVDFSMGVIPATNPAAMIDIGRGVSFSLATATLLVTSPLDIENPVSSTIRITP